MSTVYNLEVPATKEKIQQLFDKIALEQNWSPNSIDDKRIKLQFGTTELMCKTEEARREHGSNVKVSFALMVLWEAYHGCENGTVGTG